ncbi:hypothetical protein BD779DRAFT_1539285 [Infundibulicybe gibba]|nr:hypothetical protein BD779DRAFT_1539285 [Infundibulicybe gibba]
MRPYRARLGVVSACSAVHHPYTRLPDHSSLYPHTPPFVAALTCLPTIRCRSRVPCRSSP